jgi:excisionase family DNA binding protein
MIDITAIDQLSRKKTTHPPMPDLAEFMTTEEASKKLKLHIVTVRNMIRNKKLEGVKIGGKTWLVSKKSVENYRIETEEMSKNDPRRGRKS